MSVFRAVVMTFFLSMVPVLELRAAIPFGVANGLSPPGAMVTAILGNLVPVPFIILFIRRIFGWLKSMKRVRGVVERLERRAARKSEAVRKYAWLGLCVLVAIPLPGTGAWTGALVAALMDIRLKRAMPAIALGVVIAGVIVTGLSYGFLHIFG